MNVTIAPEVALAEARAKIDWLEQRCLLLRQAHQEAEDAKAALKAENEKLTDRLDELDRLDDEYSESKDAE